MTEFHLLRPLWLLALLPLAFLVWQMAKPAILRSSWSRICDPHLLPHILHQPAHPVTQLAPWLVALTGSLLVFALSGPVWQRLPQPVFHAQSALIVLLDLSHSMDATDLKPSRLVRAKHKIVDILRQRQEGQTALLVFASAPFVVTPLTHDTATISTHLASLDTALMPAQGSRPDRAVRKATQLLHQGGIAHGTILLLTDEWAGTDQAARYAVEEGHTLSILGVGTPEGAPVPLMDGGFLRDAHDTIVIAKLDKKWLQHLAQLGHGRYHSLRTDDQDIEAVLSQENHPTMMTNSQKTSFNTDVWHEEGPWIVLLMLPLVALAWRRGILVFFLVLLSNPESASALEWQTLWQRPDQQAMQWLATGDRKKAAQLFEHLEWRAVAYYRAGEFQKAIHMLRGQTSIRALYNTGNALAKLGRLEDAARMFIEVLRRQPDHADARYNLDQIMKILKWPKNKGATGSGLARAQQSLLHGTDKSQGSRHGDSEEQQENGAEPQQTDTPQDPDTQSVDPSSETGTIGTNEAEREAQQAQLKESQQAKEQWLRRVTDDPGGLLRRKFRYQYQRENMYERADTTTQAGHPW